MLRGLRHTAAVQQFVGELVYQGLHNAVALRPTWVRWSRFVPPGAEGIFDRVLAESADRAGQILTRSSESILAAVDDEALQDAVEIFWDSLAKMPLGPLRDGLSESDIDDLAALGYAFWQELRESSLYRGLIERAVEAVFARYGAMTLRALLDDLGIDRAMMLDEARRYAPSALAAMRERGVLEGLIRRQLAPFYASEAFERAIQASRAD